MLSEESANAAEGSIADSDSDSDSSHTVSKALCILVQSVCTLWIHHISTKRRSCIKSAWTLLRNMFVAPHAPQYTDLVFEGYLSFWRAFLTYFPDTHQQTWSSVCVTFVAGAEGGGGATLACGMCCRHKLGVGRRREAQVNLHALHEGQLLVFLLQLFDEQDLMHFGSLIQRFALDLLEVRVTQLGFACLLLLQLLLSGQLALNLNILYCLHTSCTHGLPGPIA